LEAAPTPDGAGAEVVGAEEVAWVLGGAVGFGPNKPDVGAAAVEDGAEVPDAAGLEVGAPPKLENSPPGVADVVVLGAAVLVLAGGAPNRLAVAAGAEVAGLGPNKFEAAAVEAGAEGPAGWGPPNGLEVLPAEAAGAG
jgi:hypothetical protein